MKHITKIISLLLCLLLLLTSVISCAPSETQNTVESTAGTTVADTTEAPDTTSPELTIEYLTEDFTGGEYTLDESPVRPHELFTALYRIAGEPEASWNFDVDWVVGKKEDYYFNATIWSAFQAGIIPFVANFEFRTSNHYSVKLKLGFSVVDKTIDEVMAEFPEQVKGREIASTEAFLDFETDISRSDAILSMYYYVTTYLGKDIVTEDVLETIADYELFTEKHSERYKMYINDNSNGYPELRKDLSASWNWALDAGIVEPYPDNTLRPDATLTRAEFAAMLTRFMDYVK